MGKQQNILWLGAHKTGTTYLQDVLSKSRFALAQAEILYVGMQAFRSRYTKPVLYAERDASRSVAYPSRSLKKNGRYLIFDENILSLVQNVLSPQGFYFGGEDRALQLMSVLKLPTPMLVLGIRRYSSFLPSLYCETLKAQPFQTFKDFQKTYFSAMSWCDLAERLLAAFPCACLRIYQAEHLRHNEVHLLSWVCGTSDITIWEMSDKAPSARREGFSHEAIMALHDRAKVRGEDKITALDLAACLKEYPREGGRAFDPWAPHERDALDLRYSLDIEAIKALPRTDFWAPPH